MEKNIAFISEDSFVNYLLDHGYKQYGDFIIRGRQSYGYLCAQIIEESFPDGIKLYDSGDLDKLRGLVKNKYGDIGLSDDNRALSARLSDYLVLSGRGRMTAASNVNIDPNLLEEIRQYIDTIPSSTVEYSELFARFESKLLSSGNVNNHDFLHGVL